MGADFTDASWPRRQRFYGRSRGSPVEGYEWLFEFLEKFAASADRQALALMQKAQPTTTPAELARIEPGAGHQRRRRFRQRERRRARRCCPQPRIRRCRGITSTRWAPTHSLGPSSTFSAPTHSLERYMAQIGSGAPHAGAYRAPAAGRNGVVAAAHGLAATAGLRVLFEGGTAVDAAVAVGAALGVVEPFMSGIGGGGGFMLIYEAATRTVHSLDYLGSAPAAADPAAFSSLDEIDTDVRSATVPSILAGWMAAHERFGRLDRASLFRPAIELAEGGWPVSQWAAGVFAATRRASSGNATGDDALPGRRRGAGCRQHRHATGSGAQLPPDRRGRRRRLLSRRARPAAGGRHWRCWRVGHGGRSGRLRAALARAAGGGLPRLAGAHAAAAVVGLSVSGVPEDAGGDGPRVAGPQLGRLPAPGAGDDQAGQRRPDRIRHGRSSRRFASCSARLRRRAPAARST